MDTLYRQFYTTVMEYYADHARDDLPWRKKASPYRVLVSEIMLQQTQVDRVIPFFTKWMKAFPTWRALAKAKQSEVLLHWKGLGYNSRALRLHALAKKVDEEYKGRLPSDYQALISLPGIGPYTAGAVRAFAFNLWTYLIETNIRRVFIHHFFKEEAEVHDAQIMECMKEMGELENPQEWYAALMDYGASLPKIVKYNPNRQSKHYTKQSTFKGSDRQIRGKILDILLNARDHSCKKKVLCNELGNEEERYLGILTDLEKEGFIMQKGSQVVLK